MQNLDKDTVQWCVDELAALVDRRMKRDGRTKKNSNDDIIAAVGLVIARRYEEAIAANDSAS